MRRANLRRWRRAALVLAAAIVCAGSPAFGASDIVFTDDNVTRVFTGGSDTTYFVLNDLAAAYNESEGCNLNAVTHPPTLQENQCQGATLPEGLGQTNALRTENYDHDLVINYFPQGSDAGRRQLCEQTAPRSGLVPPVHIARSSSAPAVGFQCSGYTGSLRFIAFAKDALTWVRWNTGGGGSTGVTNLTQAQLNDIFVDCLITTWDQVGGANTNAIRVWTPIASSGSRKTWDAFLGGSSATCIPAALQDGNTANGERVIREHRAQPVEEAVNDPDAADEGNSILPFSVGIHNVSPDAAQSSILESVDGIFPNDATIQDGSFPFSRFLYNVIRQTGPTPVATEAARRFTNSNNGANPANEGWLCKPEAQHGEPLGTAGAGIESAFASEDYGKAPPAILHANGFVPLIPDTNETGSRCIFTDVAVAP